MMSALMSLAYLMNLLRDYMKNCLARSRKNNMRVRVIGDKSRLDEDLRASIEELENESASFTGLNFSVAINYGGRDEILRAFRKMTVDLSKNAGSSPDNLDNELEKIDEKMISSYLDTAEIPDPDLIIRTSGEQRISNFLLWQLAYSEFYFTDTLWPDFSKKELMKAIEYYSQRNRRFGGV